MTSQKTKILAVVGPTASGKTSLSISLAKELGGEIISCDSMQIYKGMDIGTAKPTKEEMNGIPHHLIDIAFPTDEFSVADYKPLAEKAISEISEKGKVPIFCGGTGLYLDSLLSISDFSPEIPEGIREELQTRTPDELWDELLKVDPESAEKTHKNNVKRVIRALEIYKGTGKTKTEWDATSKTTESRYDALIIGLDFIDREKLYDRINLRVDLMLEGGLIDELRRLNLKRNSNAAQAIGYKELYSYLDGKISYNEAVELLKKNTRNYAKRQLTWFRRNKSCNWFFGDSHSAEENFKNIVNIAKKHLTD